MNDTLIDGWAPRWRWQNFFRLIKKRRWVEFCAYVTKIWPNFLSFYNFRRIENFRVIDCFQRATFRSKRLFSTRFGRLNSTTTGSTSSFLNIASTTRWFFHIRFTGWLKIWIYYSKLRTDVDCTEFKTWIITGNKPNRIFKNPISKI